MISSLNNTNKNCKSPEISSVSVNAFSLEERHRDGEMCVGRRGWDRVWVCVTGHFIGFFSFF